MGMVMVFDHSKKRNYPLFRDTFFQHYTAVIISKKREVFLVHYLLYYIITIARPINVNIFIIAV